MISSIEEADAISVAEVIDEEHFEPSMSKIEENNNRSRQTRLDKHDRVSPARRNERKRSYPEDNGTNIEPKMKVSGPWLDSRNDQRTEEKSGTIVTGVKSSHRSSPCPKKPFVNQRRPAQPFIQALFDVASDPDKYDNALSFIDRYSYQTGQTKTQVF